MFVPDFKIFKQHALKANLIPVYKELFADIETPVTTYLKLKEQSLSFLLESAEGDGRWGRYSFIGFNPLITITYQYPQMVIKTVNQQQIYSGVTDPLPFLRETISQFSFGRCPRATSFPGRISGIFCL
ncbi:MAG: Anthranilate synthase component 1 [Candidatus Methanoperedenaceae archaeon GB50]|nr:MAG: Anthranilate synthase component 1 [Candidatus Methanoperedenaceae archaeon GB50]